jgi:hypothetical protein
MSRVVRGNFQVALKFAQLTPDRDDEQEIIGRRRILKRQQPCLLGVEHFL